MIKRSQLGKWLTAGLGLLAMAWGAAQAQPPTRIAAAAYLRFALDDIVENYRQEYPERAIEVIYGSSGRFYAQIVNGAPFDLYLSADIAYPKALAEAGLAATEVQPYALGRIVLWSSTREASELNLAVLQQPEFRRIAIANPRHAPYGARAREALLETGLWQELESRLVYGENIAHTLQLVQSGAAEVGIIALSLALSPTILSQGGYYLIDDALHQPLEQGFIVTARAADNDTAHHFAHYLWHSESRSIMRAYGFMLPDE